MWEAVFDFSSPFPSIVHALRQSDGAQRWQADVPSRVAAVAITGDLVWYTSTGSTPRNTPATSSPSTA